MSNQEIDFVPTATEVFNRTFGVIRGSVNMEELTKEYFAAQLDDAVAFALKKHMLEERQRELMSLAYTDQYREELKFLVDMSYTDQMSWIRDCFIDYARLCESDPEKYKPTNVIGATRAVRKWRKERRKAIREAKHGKS